MLLLNVGETNHFSVSRRWGGADGASRHGAWAAVNRDTGLPERWRGDAGTNPSARALAGPQSARGTDATRYMLRPGSLMGSSLREIKLTAKRHCFGLSGPDDHAVMPKQCTGKLYGTECLGSGDLWSFLLIRPALASSPARREARGMYLCIVILNWF